ncbi:ATP-binding cassette sub- B member 10, mitochondrial [Blyttiomyces sp. JEL0837]|nr:ATP-binding cassette sub- B member 10, mitochondrial [Blyttiomyces sp. JEL0837]
MWNHNRTGELISRLSADTVIVGKAITNNISDGLRSSVTAFVGIGMMAYANTQLTEAISETTKVAEEKIGSIRTVRSFAQEPTEIGRYRDRVQDVYNISMKEAWASAYFFGSAGFSGNIIMLAILYYGGSMVQSGAISTGDLTSFFLYTAYVGSSFIGLSGFYSELMKGIGASSRLFSLLETSAQVESHDGGIILAKPQGKIEFKDIHFAYPTRPDVRIFNGLSFDVAPGSNVAIVGKSGSGKSSLAQLLLRFYDPASGSIYIDGVNLRGLDLKQVRDDLIAYVAQEPVLFAATIRENIAYGRPGCSLEEVVAAAELANAHDFIKGFPAGYDTFVGEKGVAISGGQKQRIAIARALLKNPKILIMDEATSALDAASEYLVQDALSKIVKGRTVITIAHRLSTIKQADTVVMVEGGKVIESGSYGDLINRPSGHFRALVEAQLYDDDEQSSLPCYNFTDDKGRINWSQDGGATDTQVLTNSALFPVFANGKWAGFPIFQVIPSDNYYSAAVSYIKVVVPKTYKVDSIRDYQKMIRKGYPQFKQGYYNFPIVPKGSKLVDWSVPVAKTLKDTPKKAWYMGNETQYFDFGLIPMDPNSTQVYTASMYQLFDSAGRNNGISIVNAAPGEANYTGFFALKRYTTDVQSNTYRDAGLIDVVSVDQNKIVNCPIIYEEPTPFTLAPPGTPPAPLTRLGPAPTWPGGSNVYFLGPSDNITTLVTYYNNATSYCWNFGTRSAAAHDTGSATSPDQSQVLVNAVLFPVYTTPFNNGSARPAGDPVFQSIPSIPRYSDAVLASYVVYTDYYSLSMNGIASTGPVLNYPIVNFGSKVVVSAEYLSAALRYTVPTIKAGWFGGQRINYVDAGPVPLVTNAGTIPTSQAILNGLSETVVQTINLPDQATYSQFYSLGLSQDSENSTSYTSFNQYLVKYNQGILNCPTAAVRFYF